MPNVVGLTQANATTAINGLAVGTVTQQNSNTVPTGNVVSQDPASGGSVKQGSPVNLVIASGPLMVPNLVGLTEADATKTITGAQLTVGTVTKEHSATVASGTIIRQDPAAETSVTQGTPINLFVAQATGLPPDPSAVAPPVDATVVTTFSERAAVLYRGPNPIQTDVAPNTILPSRAAVLRGKVLDKANLPLPGVTITVLNHPEFGQTLSRVDGMFDMAVNGGGQLSINYAKTGLFSAQRQLQVPWQDFALAPDVILIAQDPHETRVDLTSNAAIQVARGSILTDSDGTRQATLFFPQGTQATMVMPNGSTAPLTTLNVRATEYTVGPNGPEAMLAGLPPTSAYTYAAELSADEAISAGATSVTFNKPVIFHAENFLKFPIGTAVPMGYYDRGKGVWVPSDNGRVIKILSVTGSIAELDIDGSGSPANAAALAALGVSDAEREQLAAMYPSGQSLWRVPITHFTPWDANWGFGPPSDAGPPNVATPPSNNPESDPSIDCGSIIESENQILREEVSIAGTTLGLYYTTDRVPGRITADTVKIQLSGSTVPPSLTSIKLDIQIAGREVTGTFPAAPNQSFTFTWDRKDAYGRTVQGARSATINIGYVYDAVYQPTSRFGYTGGGLVISGNLGSRQALVIWQTEHASVGHFDAFSQGLGGWNLSIHHLYDEVGKVLYLGDGTRRNATDLGATLITTAAGSGQAPGFGGDNGPATQALLFAPVGVAAGPDGSLYIADTGNNRVRRVDSSGIITTVVGTGLGGFSGDGGPATQAQIFNPQGIAVGLDGSLYVLDNDNNRVRRIDPKGIITTVAGNGQRGFGGDGGPATEAQFDMSLGLAVGPDGSLYIADTGNNRVRRVDTGGIIATVAGTGQDGFAGDFGPAIQAKIFAPQGISVGYDGNLYIADSGNNRVRRVDTSGIITTVAGTGQRAFGGDGGPATQAQIFSPLGVAVDPEGNLYIADTENHRVRRVDPGGVITTIEGTGQAGFSGDGGPATQAQIFIPEGIAVGFDGSLYTSAVLNHRVRQTVSSMPGVSISDSLIAAADGSELYLFDSLGRHLRTFNALTGAIRYQFSYDSAGRLNKVTDGNGDVTTVEHDASENPSAIVGSFGQRTTLTVDANGYLSTITDPAGGTSKMGYTPTGLLTEFTDPNGHSTSMKYDDFGRLVRDEDPAGGFTALVRTDADRSYTVSLTTALGRTAARQVENLATGDERRVKTFPDGIQAELLIGVNGSRETRLSNGTVFDLLQGPDPRFSMQAPLPKSLTTAAGGVTSTVITERTVTLAEPLNLLSLTSLTDRVTVNGRTFTRSFDAASKMITNTTAAGRQSTTTIDTQGRDTQAQVSGLLAVNLTYDNHGRLATITQGTGNDQRTARFSYSPDGYLQTVTDPLGRSLNLLYDAAGRITRSTLPDSREITYGYAANGNLISLTPTGRPAHRFSYTPVYQTSEYTPPSVIGAGNTVYTYNADRQLTLVTRPDQKTIGFAYDCCLNKTIIARGVYTYAHDPITGRLSSITAPDGGTLTYSFNGSLLTNITLNGTVAGAVSRAYDNDFRVTSLSVNGTPVNFNYDADGLLTQAGGLTLTRDPQKNGLLTGTMFGNESEALSYNGFSELTGTSASSNGTLLTEQYTRDQLGRITQKVETIDGTTSTLDYTYDAAGRLIEVKQNGIMAAKYTYDGNNNRTTVNRNDVITSGTSDDQDRLTRYGDTTYAYTANGELQSETVNGRTTTYNYDEFGNLLSVILPDNTVIEYVIDGRNRRIGKKVGGTLVKGFLYQDDLKPVAELDNNNKVVSRFVYATRSNVPDYMVKNGATFRILIDQLGSPRLVVDATTGAIAQSMNYDEFGRIMQDTNPGFQPFGFAGGLYDPDTKLVRFGARDYEAETGRWTAKDPMRFSGGDTNLYSYVMNDPVNVTDPTGLQNWTQSLWAKVLALWMKFHDADTPQAADQPNPSDQRPAPETPDPGGGEPPLPKPPKPGGGGEPPLPGAGSGFCTPLIFIWTHDFKCQIMDPSAPDCRWPL